MPDRSLRLLALPPLPAQEGEHSRVLLRERPASPPDAPSGRTRGDGREGGAQEDNPFAPPPEGAPDRPWQPRGPVGRDSGGRGGSGGSGGSGDSGDSDGSSGEGGHSSWGSQWSDRQPGRSSGGFGERPGAQRGDSEGPAPKSPGPGANMRWDPTDPVQRRARYALLGGMWAFFFSLFGWPYVALLLGALSLYWGISALRAKPRAGAGPEAAGRPQTTAAVSGLVTASLAIVLVAANFAAHLVYSDYYSCRSDALTSEARQSCNQHLPKELRGVLDANS
ncbi:hypothetical protein ABT301_07795 [Streptomyces sp. NPDC000987]|uniref:hypothetical protein n=1 Tax=Streptomyces sp. NPDC000987 TaxID=3154374 RepID=UPI0033216DE5